MTYRCGFCGRQNKKGFQAGIKAALFMPPCDECILPKLLKAIEEIKK